MSYTVVIGVIGWIVFVGAMVGGWLFDAAGAAGVTGFNIWSLMVAVIGAVAFLVVWHAIRARPHTRKDARPQR